MPIIRNMAPVLLMSVRVTRYEGIPVTAAIPKQISCRFVRLKASFVFSFDKSVGTLT